MGAGDRYERGTQIYGRPARLTSMASGHEWRRRVLRGGAPKTELAPGSMHYAEPPLRASSTGLCHRLRREGLFFNGVFVKITYPSSSCRLGAAHRRFRDLGWLPATQPAVRVFARSCTTCTGHPLAAATSRKRTPCTCTSPCSAPHPPCCTWPSNAPCWCPR